MESPKSSARPSDRVLVGSMRDPGSDALVVLLRRHADALHDYVSTAVADAVAEDVFMLVFVRAWSELTVRRMPGDSALPWMLATARDAAGDRLHRHAPATASPDADGLLAGRSGALLAALERLSPRERCIVELCLVENRSYRQAVRQTRPRPGGGLRGLLHPRDRSRGAVAILRGNANG